MLPRNLPDDFEELFVPLAVRRSEDPDASTAQFTLDRVIDRLMLVDGVWAAEDVVRPDQKHRSQAGKDVRVVILQGAPGSGKTFTSCCMYQHYNRRYMNGDPVRRPVLVSLANFRKELQRGTDLLEEYFRRHAGLDSAAIDRLRSQKLFIFLDGLDEAADRITENIFNHVDLSRWRQCRFCITVRHRFMIDSCDLQFLTPNARESGWLSLCCVLMFIVSCMCDCDQATRRC